MRILGLDHGDRYVGLALSDPLGWTAQPYGTYELSGRDEADRAFFRKLVADQDVGEIVVGIPLRMDGSSGSRADKTRAFGRWLEETAGRPVRFWDERLTTQQATTILHEQKVKLKDRRSVVNQISATIILQAYLDRRRGDESLPPER